MGRATNNLGTDLESAGLRDGYRLLACFKSEIQFLGIIWCSSGRCALFSLSSCS